MQRKYVVFRNDEGLFQATSDSGMLASSHLDAAEKVANMYPAGKHVFEVVAAEELIQFTLNSVETKKINIIHQERHGNM